MSETYYVVMEKGFEYDDQNYTPSNHGGGHPQLVFTSKKKAEAAAEESGLKEFKRLYTEGSLREYFYDDLDYVIADGTTEDDLYFEEGIFMTLFGMGADKWYESLFDGKVDFKVEPTEEQWKKLASCFNLYFYEVVTVQKG